MNAVMLKKLQMSLSGPRTGVSGLYKKQVKRTLSADMIMLTRKNNGRSSRLVYPVEIISYNGKGVCINWNFCSFCSGYEQGRVHQNCLFAGFDYSVAETRELVFNIEVPGSDKTLVFRGRVVYTYKQESGEKVGITFTYLPEETREYLDSNFRN